MAKKRHQTVNRSGLRAFNVVTPTFERPHMSPGVFPPPTLDIGPVRGPVGPWRESEYGRVDPVRARVRGSAVGRPVGPKLVPADCGLWSLSRRHPRWHAWSTVSSIARRVSRPALRRRVLQGQLCLPHLLRRRSVGRPTPPDSRFLDGHRSESVTGRSVHVSGSAPSRLIGCVPFARPAPTAALSLLISRVPTLTRRAHAHAGSPLDQSTFQMRAPWVPETTQVTPHTSTCPTPNNIVPDSHPLVSPHTPNRDPAHHQQPSRGGLWARPRRISGR